MRKNFYIDIFSGLFLLFSLLSILFLFTKVENVDSINAVDTYKISAIFEDIGSLKNRAPVKIGGVIIGRVVSIELDKSLSPKVTMLINARFSSIPKDSMLSIHTNGLLGSQYLSLFLGIEADSFLQEGDAVLNTNSAIYLESIISKVLSGV